MEKKKAKSDAPAALAKAVAKLANRIDGRFCYGLPGYTLDTKLKVVLVELGNMDLFEDNEVDRDELGDWLPFAELKGEPQFLAINKNAPYAVGMWEHETGEICAAWETPDDFASKLLEKKSDKTPFEKLAKTFDKVAKLIENDAYADALGILDPVMKTLPKVPAGRSSFDDGGRSRAYSFYGIALKGVNKRREAREAFEIAVAAGDDYAMLNILSMLEDANEPQQLLDYAIPKRAAGYFDDYCRIWLARYIGVAHALAGDPVKGEAELRASLEKYAISEPDKITAARENLQKLVDDGHPGAAAVRPFLAWYKPKSYEVTPAQAKTNRALWTSFPEGMRGKLMEAIGKDGQEPTDEDIARSLDIGALHLDEEDGTFDKLDVFLNFPRLVRLAFYGDPDDLQALRTLKLEYLTVNNDVIKGLKYPSRADRDLIAAAEKVNKKAMEQALAAGASVTARDDSGETALYHAARKRDLDVCLWLVSKGSDPWAGTHGESTPISKFDDEGRDALAAAARKAGLGHPDDDPYRVLDRNREPNAATFESDHELDLEDGESLAGKWPADVQLTMKSPKKENKLYDLHVVNFRGLIASERLAEVLRGPNVELYPVTLVDHAGKKRPEKYFLVNPLAVDCLEVEKCYPNWNHIDPDSISDIPAYVMDPAKVGGAQLFRLGRVNSHPTIITRELADKIAGFTGVGVDYCKR
jgi:hypothetical protein